MTAVAPPAAGRSAMFAPVLCGARAVSDGSVLECGHDLPADPRTLVDLLEGGAAAHPERPFVAERDGAGWRRCTYGEMLAGTRRLAQGLLDLGCSPERPVLILARNGISHARLALAAMTVGIPVAQVSPNYARGSGDFAKLRHVLGLLRPSLVVFDEASACRGAGAAVDWGGARLAAEEADDDAGVSRLEQIEAEPTRAVADRRAEIGPDTVAKILFTSGSTGSPKGVVNTHRMMVSNQQALAAVWPFLGREPPVLVDWLPWNHTFGSNQNFNIALFHGGTLHVDPGRPMPGAFEDTISALTSVSPTVYFNVPLGYDMLSVRLETDEELRASFFRRLKLMGYAGASIPTPVWERLRRLAVRTRGTPVPLAGMWGSTETAPISTAVHFENSHPGNLGVPVPGTALKLVPNGLQTEIRIRGPNVSPGYWTPDGIVPLDTDPDGFYRIGDAGRLVEPDDPGRGILFDGRVVENFKLSSGTWVNAGAVRLAAVSALSSLVSDAVVAGHDREELGLMLFPKLDGCRALVGASPEMPVEDLLSHPALIADLAGKLAAGKPAEGGSATRVRRFVLLVEPPSAEDNEITDKGYLNQRAILRRRAGDVAMLYGGVDHPRVGRVP